MSKYKLTKYGIRRQLDGAFIPDDPGNRDYKEYLEYVASGGVTDPEFTVEEIKERNRLKALRKQEESIAECEKDDIKLKYGIGVPKQQGTKKVIENYIRALQAEIDNPSTSENYEPPQDLSVKE